MNTVFKIIEKHNLLFDSIDSYGYWESTSKNISTDEKGEYRLKTIVEEKPCSCHPETCCHFDGKISTERTEKIYI